ncbi:hypothetical protein WA026_017822 [Henosepilachna vigintioctopunctata]|uniref:CHK kinase-like domain-containing protein n=1 Tax=Henosepilachna vigintioctopunctata TaxID=420089 RepID=A0AAW1TVH5_9CUCU
MEKLPSVFEEMMSDYDFKSANKSTMERALKVVEGNAKATTGLERFIEKSNEFFKETIKIKDKYTVITHGDCWCNNFMFKYKSENSQEISKTILLDWQLSTTSSPILDISYFFYSCSSKHCIDNYISYLTVYYNSLSAMLKQFGMNVDEVMTFEDLQLQWQSYAKYGMYMAILIIKIMLAKQEETPEIKDLLQEKEAMDIFKVDISNEQEYDERIGIIVNHMVENEFI